MMRGFDEAKEWGGGMQGELRKLFHSSTPINLKQRRSISWELAIFDKTMTAFFLSGSNISALE